MAKVEIDVELLSDLVDAAGWVGNFYNDLSTGTTQEYHPDWGAVQYLASEAVLTEQRGRAVLEAVEQSGAGDGLWDCAHCDNRQIGDGFAECPNCGTARA